MRGQTKRVSFSTPPISANMDAMDDALAAIQSLEPGESINYTEIAAKHGLVRSTLTRRYNALTQSRKAAASTRRKLSLQQEQELVQYIKKLTKEGLPPTRQMVQNFAASIAQSTVSIRWVDQFLKRNSANLISRWTAGIDRNRHKADSEAKYRLYFELLQQKISQYNIEPCNTYNMDEKGILLGILSRSKRIFSRALYERKEVRQAIQDSDREWISILACICADGSALDPALIY
jgi:transposase-like protein